MGNLVRGTSADNPPVVYGSVPTLDRPAKRALGGALSYDPDFFYQGNSSCETVTLTALLLVSLVNGNAPKCVTIAGTANYNTAFNLIIIALI